VWSAQARTHGFAQFDPLSGRTITRFRSTAPDVYYESNARNVQTFAFDGGAMDRFVPLQESAVLESEKRATPAQRSSVGIEAMYHLDCATIPFLWAYAKRFTLFDNFFEALRGPSTPSNIEIIAAQNGLTQFVRHPADRTWLSAVPGVPLFVDLDPAFGPYNPAEPSVQHQVPQTYANLLLLLQRGLLCRRRVRQAARSGRVLYQRRLAQHIGAASRQRRSIRADALSGRRRSPGIYRLTDF